METEPPSHFQIWLTFLEMVAILVCLANNMIKLYGMKTKSLKFWFLVTVSGSGALRGISLLVIMEQPSGAWLDFLYTAPTLLWIQSFIIFIGHLVICYQVLANKDSNFVHQCICYSPLCLALSYSYFFIKEEFLERVLILEFVLYASFMAACFYYSNKLFSDLEEDTDILPFLTQVNKLIETISISLAVRLLVFFLIFTGYVNMTINLILLEVFVGELIPCYALTFFKIPGPKPPAPSDQRPETNVEMQNLKEPLTK